MVPLEERNVSDIPAEASQQPRFQSRCAVDDVFTAVLKVVKRPIDLDGELRFGLGEVEREAFRGHVFESVDPAHLLEHRRDIVLQLRRIRRAISLRIGRSK